MKLQWPEMGKNGLQKGGEILTHKQTKALAALLTQPTKEKAASAAGIGLTTLKRYLADPEFQAEYQKAVSNMIADAATQAKQSLNPALSCLREIVENGDETATARVQAARVLLEYGLRLTEIVDVVKKLEELEQEMGVKA